MSKVNYLLSNDMNKISNKITISFIKLQNKFYFLSPARTSINIVDTRNEIIDFMAVFISFADYGRYS